MAKKAAKTASKNIPSQRQKKVETNYNGRPVVPVVHYGADGSIACVAGYKEDIIAGKGGDVFVRNASGNMLLWSDLP